MKDDDLWCMLAMVFTVEDTVGHSTTGGNGESILVFFKWLAIYTGVLEKEEDGCRNPGGLFNYVNDVSNEAVVERN